MYIFDDYVIQKVAKQCKLSSIEKFLKNTDISEGAFIEWLRPFVTEQVKLKDFNEAQLKSLTEELMRSIELTQKASWDQDLLKWNEIMNYQQEELERLIETLNGRVGLNKENRIQVTHLPEFLSISFIDLHREMGRPVMYAFELDLFPDLDEYVIRGAYSVEHVNIKTYFEERAAYVLDLATDQLSVSEADVLERLDQMRVWVDAFHELDLKTAAYASSIGLIEWSPIS